MTKPHACLNLAPATKKIPFYHCNMKDGREGYCPHLSSAKRARGCRFYKSDTRISMRSPLVPNEMEDIDFPPPPSPPPKRIIREDISFGRKKSTKVIAEAKAGETMDMSDLVSLFDDMVELTDYCHRDPTRTEYKVLKSFKVIVEE